MSISVPSPEQIVVDTCGIISYFAETFRVASTVSKRSLAVIESALNDSHSTIRLIVPSVVFIEIIDKWFIDLEFQYKLYYEVFVPLRDCENVSIRPVFPATIEHLINLDGALSQHDLHDKLVAAVAMEMDARIVTSDGVIKSFFTAHGMGNRVLG